MNKKLTLSKIDHYLDRVSGCGFDSIIEVADKCVNGVVPIWDKYEIDVNKISGNLYEFVFDGVDIVLKFEYLFAMDYLSYVAEAYKITKQEEYKATLYKYLAMYSKFIKTKKYLEGTFSIFNEHTIYTQTVLFAKILDVFDELPFSDEFAELLIQFAGWLLEDKNKIYTDNHGMFQVLALLHMAELLGESESKNEWIECAVIQANTLFSNLYFLDGTNFENSMSYFKYNNYLFSEVIDFCDFYSISGIDSLRHSLTESKDKLKVIAHSDKSLPLIGDGRNAHIDDSVCESCVFKDLGLAVIKKSNIYLSYKNKTVYTWHAHEDVSSITLRYKNTDILVDSGQFNYDRYTPINRYVRSAAGHSSFLPVYADTYFLGDFVKKISHSVIHPLEESEDSICVRGEYVLDDIETKRIIEIRDDRITVIDRWHCDKSTVMRQRFILPNPFVENIFFSVSKKCLEARVNGLKVRFEVSSNTTEAFTVCNFGVAAPEYNQYETTLLLDTFVNNVLSGEIIVNIYIEEVVDE